ncbi:MAG: DUF2802 domain-containing protein [Methylococcaceae bacterium]
MNPPLANTLTNASNDLVLIGFSITAIILIAMLFALLWLSRLVSQLKRDCANLTDIVDGNKNDIYGLCSAALTVNENTATSHEELHDLKQQLASIVEKMSDLQNEIQQGDFVNSPYNVDIRKIRDGASVEELMKQSDLSYDEAALLIRLHGGKA